MKMLPNSAETIEKLARALEREKLLARLNECVSLEDFQKVREELKALSQQQN